MAGCGTARCRSCQSRLAGRRSGWQWSAAVDARAESNVQRRRIVPGKRCGDENAAQRLRMGGLGRESRLLHRTVERCRDGGGRPGAFGNAESLAVIRWSRSVASRRNVLWMGRKARSHHEAVSRVPGMKVAPQPHSIPCRRMRLGRFSRRREQPARSRRSGRRAWKRWGWRRKWEGSRGWSTR